MAKRIKAKHSKKLKRVSQKRKTLIQELKEKSKRIGRKGRNGKRGLARRTAAIPERTLEAIKEVEAKKINQQLAYANSKDEAKGKGIDRGGHENLNTELPGDIIHQK